MKNILNLLIAAIAFTYILTSCELDRFPHDGYTDEKIFEDKEKSTRRLLVGCYSYLRDWGTAQHLLGEYPADNIMLRGVTSDQFFTYFTYNHTPTNGRVSAFWNYSYKVVVQSSELINITQGDAKYDQQRGEAYYLRGLTYFYLCRVFGRPYSQSPEKNLGIPIVNNGIPKDILNTTLPDRSTVKETYRQVISDLKNAEQLVSNDNLPIYATKAAAQALLSRVYLYMSGTYDNPNTVYADSAIYYANQVINSGKFQLLNRNDFMRYNILAPDAAGQTETIFAVKRISSEFTIDDYWYAIGSMYANIDGVGWGQSYASEKYLNLLREAGQKNDARWAFIDPQYEVGKDGKKTEAFRFVANLYNDKKVQTGYQYIQDTLRVDNGKYFIYLTIDKKRVRRDLAPDNTAENMYKITYTDSITYTGFKDYLMQLGNGYPLFYITKCSLQDNTLHLHSPIVSRLAELYLNMAEAYAKKGDYANALINLNKVRGRAIVGGEHPSLDKANASELIDKERQLELAFEGHRAFDVFRNGQTMSRKFPGVHDAMVDIPATSLRVVQYIPQRDIDAYFGKLTQNPDK